ncbi:uncharacterized protein C17orf53 homolog isoform X2 [Rhinatrema bivittatum]|uniref:uncharacterized protein C17orf53 homolog isoform X2 n=1 Tax=Rhinatrema bivittatum TaxID=194408 RepID=UPI001129A143|nr:uncharacterized protein C17orf53 homolog isoform X2 [Rhinatrema bivittatum]
MAWSLQKLFAVEEEFEDEDFLSAVKDVETTSSGPGPSVNRCLRPLTSSLQAPGGIQSAAHQLSDDHISKLSPILGFQNSSKLATGTSLPPRPTHCLRPVSSGHNHNAGSPALDFTDAQEFWTLGCTVSTSTSKRCTSSIRDQQLPCSSSAKFKFTRKSAPVACSRGDCGNVVGLESEDALFLSACTELDKPNTEEVLEPGKGEHRITHGLQEGASHIHIREDEACEGMITKKLCMAPSSYGTSSKVQREAGQLSQTGTQSMSEDPSPCPGLLNLRPSSAGGWQHSLTFTSRPTPPVTSALTPADTTRVRTLGMAYQAAGPGQASYQSGAGLSSSSHQDPLLFPFSTSSPQPFLAAKVPGPQNCISPRKPHGTFQNPPTLKPRSEPPACSPRTPSSSVTGPGALQTPVVTNHLVQLVTAAKKTPRTASWDLLQAKIRRFPGPAGILPHQHGGRNLEEILISTPHAPAHGALAKIRSEDASRSPQPTDESFGRGPWSAMKVELGLDEKDPCCFLRTCSVVMVLRKAVLKQLPKNKVPQMAVMLKSLTRATVDASAVFRDPTGEIQGTVHHLLLEERESDLKAGAVLLLQQVGVFSPSLRNHYLNVTPNNLVKIYLPASEDSNSNQGEHGASGRAVPPETLMRSTWTRLHPDTVPSSRNSTSRSHEPKAKPLEQSAGEWGIDDLDGLLGELAEESFSCMEGPH